MNEFDSIEQQRAWQSTIEQVFNYVHNAGIGPKDLIRIQKDATNGHPIAQVIMAQYTLNRMKA